MTTILCTIAGFYLGFFVAILIVKRDTIWMQQRINKLEADND